MQHLIDRVRELGTQKSILTTAELEAIGADKFSLNKLVDLDILYPSAEGIYMPDNADFGQHHTRVEVAARFPDTVICLNNALNFHNLTTQWGEGWIAYKEGGSIPIEPKLPIRPVAMSEANFSRGIETYQIEGITVKVYNVPKTVADCFIYEDIIGADVSEEAFIESVINHRCQVKDILSYLDDSNLSWYTKDNLNSCIELAPGVRLIPLFETTLTNN